MRPRETASFGSIRRLPSQTSHVQIELALVTGVEVQGLDSHRTVEIDGQWRNAVGVFEAFDPIQQLLGAPDRKGRDDQLTAAIVRSRRMTRSSSIASSTSGWMRSP